MITVTPLAGPLIALIAYAITTLTPGTSVRSTPTMQCLPFCGLVQNKNLTAIWPIRPGRAELIIPNDEGPDVMLPPGLLNCA